VATSAPARRVLPVRLLERSGVPWRGEDSGLPWFVELERDEKPRAVARAIPGRLLVDVWTSRGAPRETVTYLRARLEARIRYALRDAPSSRMVPLSIAAAELAIPERTLRDRVSRGVMKAATVDGRRGSELAVELELAGGPVRVKLSRPAPDPRKAALAR
jgi:hypothetical protein